MAREKDEYSAHVKALAKEVITDDERAELEGLLELSSDALLEIFPARAEDVMRRYEQRPDASDRQRTNIDPRIHDGMAMYLNEAGATKLFSPADEYRLHWAYDTGRRLSELDGRGDLTRRLGIKRAGAIAEQIEELFTNANLRLVVSIAKRYPEFYGADRMDHIQAGNEGLMHAIPKFDRLQGFKFSTYATFWIRQRIGRNINNAGHTVRAPHDISDAVRAINRAYNDVTFDPDADELTELQRITERTPEELAAAIGYTNRFANLVRLDAGVGDDQDESLGSYLNRTTGSTESDYLEGSWVREQVVAALMELEPREREMLAIHYDLLQITDDGSPATLKEIGARFGVTSEAARRTIERAKNHVKYRHPELEELLSGAGA